MYLYTYTNRLTGLRRSLWGDGYIGTLLEAGMDVDEWVYEGWRYNEDDQFLKLWGRGHFPGM